MKTLSKKDDAPKLNKRNILFNKPSNRLLTYFRDINIKKTQKNPLENPKKIAIKNFDNILLTNRSSNTDYSVLPAIVVNKSNEIACRHIGNAFQYCDKSNLPELKSKIFRKTYKQYSKYENNKINLVELSGLNDYSDRKVNTERISSLNTEDFPTIEDNSYFDSVDNFGFKNIELNHNEKLANTSFHTSFLKNTNSFMKRKKSSNKINVKSSSKPPFEMKGGPMFKNKLGKFKETEHFVNFLQEKNQRKIQKRIKSQKILYSEVLSQLNW